MHSLYNDIYRNRYDRIYPFKDGIAIVRKNGFYGVVLVGGRELIAPKYDYIYSFVDGYSRVIKDGRVIVIDLSGKEYIETTNGLLEVPANVYDIQECGDNLFRFAELDKSKPIWGIMNGQCEVIIPPTFVYIHNYVNNTVSKACKWVGRRLVWFIISSTSIMDEQFDFEPAVLSSGDIMVKRVSPPNYSIKNNGFCGYERDYFDIRINCEGNAVIYNNDDRFVLSKDIYRVHPINYGHYIVQDKSGKFGAIDRVGNIVAPISFTSKEQVLFPHIIKLPNGNEAVLPKETTHVYSFSGGYARFKTLEGMGIIDCSGQILIENIPFFIECNDSLSSTFTLRRTEVDDQYIGLLDIITTRIIKPNYTTIVKYNDVGSEVDISEFGIFKLDIKGCCLIIHNNGNVSLPECFIAGTQTYNGISIVRQNDLWGLYNVEKQELVAECRYHKIVYNSVGLFIASLITFEMKSGNDKKDNAIEKTNYFIYNESGELILSEIDLSEVIANDRFIVCEKGLYGMVNAFNEPIIAIKYNKFQNLGLRRLYAISEANNTKCIFDYDGNLIKQFITGSHENFTFLSFEKNKIAKILWRGFTGYMDVNGNLMASYRGSFFEVPSGYNWCFGFDGRCFSCLRSLEDLTIFKDSFIQNNPIGQMVGLDGVVLNQNIQDIGDSYTYLYNSQFFSIIRIYNNKEFGIGIVDNKGIVICHIMNSCMIDVLSKDLLAIKWSKYSEKNALFNISEGIFTECKYATARLSKYKNNIIATIQNNRVVVSYINDYSIELLDYGLKVLFSMKKAELVNEELIKDECYYLIRDLSSYKYGVVNSSGTIVLPFEYNRIWINKDGFFYVEQQNKSGVMNCQGETIIPINYKSIVKISENEFIVEDTNNYLL